MPSLHIDFPEVVVAASIGTTDTDGTPWDNGVFVIPVCIPLDQAGPWLAAYDPDNDYSPSAADSFNAFLSIKESGDDTPMIADARTRLAALQ